MSALRVHRRLIAWLAMLALGLGALAPAVAQVLAASSDRVQWTEICTATGMVWVQVDDGQQAGQAGKQPASSEEGGTFMMTCPWCALHGGAAALPSSQAQLVLPEGLAGLPSTFYQSPTASFAWAVHRSRAPPFAS